MMLSYVSILICARLILWSLIFTRFPPFETFPWLHSFYSWLDSQILPIAAFHHFPNPTHFPLHYRPPRSEFMLPNLPCLSHTYQYICYHTPTLWGLTNLLPISKSASLAQNFTKICATTCPQTVFVLTTPAHWWISPFPYLALIGLYVSTRTGNIERINNQIMIWVRMWETMGTIYSWFRNFLFCRKETRESRGKRVQQCDRLEIIGK